MPSSNTSSTKTLSWVYPFSATYKCNRLTAPSLHSPQLHYAMHQIAASSHMYVDFTPASQGNRPLSCRIKSCNILTRDQCGTVIWHKLLAAHWVKKIWIDIKIMLPVDANWPLNHRSKWKCLLCHMLTSNWLLVSNWCTVHQKMVFKYKFCSTSIFAIIWHHIDLMSIWYLIFDISRMSCHDIDQNLTLICIWVPAGWCLWNQVTAWYTAS